MTLGEKIKRLRKEHNWTQETLGQKVGVQKAAINKYETGAVINLKRKVIKDLAAALEVSPVWLMDDNSDWPPVDPYSENGQRVIPIVVPDSERFVRLVKYMPEDDYQMVMHAFERAEKRMREAEGVIE
jgi:transcriptional regulator with XRE-family HTH domain